MLKAKRYPKKLRLQNTKDFEQVYLHAKKFKKKGMALLALPNGLEYPRLGINIKKKQVARAVDRNRIKRKIRESYRNQQDQLLPLDIVVVVYNDILRQDSTEMQTCLSSLWVELTHYFRK